MMGPEIRSKIDHNNFQIQQLLTPDKSVLNTKIAELLMANKELQKNCKHEFENYIGSIPGKEEARKYRVCKYCDLEETIVGNN